MLNMRAAWFVLLLLAVIFCRPNVARVASDNPVIPVRPVHTFSIVARDTATGELGVAVQ